MIGSNRPHHWKQVMKNGNPVSGLWYCIFCGRRKVQTKQPDEWED